MKKSCVFVLLVLSQFCLLQGQDTYKQNFLNLLKKLPEIKTCEAGYNFFKCKDNSCSGYKAVKTNMAKALGDLSSNLLASGTAMTSMAQPPSMTSEQAKALSEKLDKMTSEEKQQWAMQNAQMIMNPAAAHANQDADNLEEKVAATHYGDDAQENMNKNHLFMAHQTVLNKVIENFGNYENVIIDYANKYADLQKIERVKAFVNR